MAKRNAFLHIGPAVPGVEDPHDALCASALVAGAGLRVPRVDSHHLRMAELEIRRAHKEAGLRRKDVEGRWAEVCRRAFKAKSDVIISQPGFIDANDEQMTLALHGLAGLRLHVVLSPPVEPVDALAVAGTWATAIAGKGRLHVLPPSTAGTPDGFAAGMARIALQAGEVEIDRKLAKLRKARARIARRLVQHDAA